MSSSSRSSSSRPRSAANIRQAEHEAFVKSSLESHGGYLAQPIIHTAESLDITPLHLSYFMAALALAIHLILPAFLLPHYSALITLIPPIQSTMRSITLEVKKSSREAKDSAQWCTYWVIYVLLDLVRGMVAVYRPGAKPAFELGRTICLVICGGPWFGRAGLRPDPPSEELQKAEKAEAAAEKEREEKQKQREKEKRKKDDKSKRSSAAQR